MSYETSKLIKKHKLNLNNQIEKINNYSKFINFTIKENKIHIIVRTHLREFYFKQTINSILSQTYENLIIHIAYDHDTSFEYIKR